MRYSRSIARDCHARVLYKQKLVLTSFLQTSHSDGDVFVAVGFSSTICFFSTTTFFGFPAFGFDTKFTELSNMVIYSSIFTLVQR